MLHVREAECGGSGGGLNPVARRAQVQQVESSLAELVHQWEANRVQMRLNQDAVDSLRQMLDEEHVRVWECQVSGGMAWVYSGAG